MPPNKNLKIAAIVITYYPEVDEAVKNIKQYIRDIDHLIIWENTPLPEREKYRMEIPEYQHKITYKSVDRNAGIAYPLNQCAAWAKQNDYTHILSMDQDSYWENFEAFMQFVANNPDNNRTIVAPNVNNECKDLSIETVARFDAITSGTLWPLYVIDKVGLFDEELFVDAVDTDYSIRAKREGFKILIFVNSHLTQRFGYTKESKRLHIGSSNYSAKRTYSIIKSSLILWRRYRKELPDLYKKIILRTFIFYRLIKIILIEDDKFNKIVAVFRGIFDGLRKPIY